jgi:hypothetical protein
VPESSLVGGGAVAAVASGSVSSPVSAAAARAELPAA